MISSTGAGWTGAELVEWLQTNGFAGERRIKETFQLRVLVNVIDHLCQELQTLTAHVPLVV